MTYFDFTSIRAGDEIVRGPLTGVRFWMYSLKGMRIMSFQSDHVWRPGLPTVDNEAVPTIENERGINVYKTEADAMRGSADAINDIIDRPHRWIESGCGIVLGTVNFWGVAVEYEFGYAAQVVLPTQFLQAWGAHNDTISSKLNKLWFGETDG